jgi:hypothetical protein
MKRSNLDLLFQRYICGETCLDETIKIEVLLKEIEARGIHFLSVDTEELLFRKITDAKISSDEIPAFVRNLSKLKVPGEKSVMILPVKFIGRNPFFFKELCQEVSTYRHG